MVLNRERFCLSGEHSAVSGDSLGCHSCREGESRSWLLVEGACDAANLLQCTGPHPTAKSYRAPGDKRARWKSPGVGGQRDCLLVSVGLKVCSDVALVSNFGIPDENFQ